MIEYVRISQVDTLEDGFIIEIEEARGHYIYVTPNPPQQESEDSTIIIVEESDDDEEIIWF